MSNSNDDIHDLFDSLPRQTTPLFQPKGGARYRFGWDDESEKSDWRADGYRWRQNGSCPAKCTNGVQLTENVLSGMQFYSYFTVCESRVIGTYYKAIEYTIYTLSIFYRVIQWWLRLGLVFK